MTKSRTSTPLRTTWRWTWLSGGTSIRTSPRSAAVQLSRRSAARPWLRRYSASIGAGGLRCSGSDVIPCLGNDPTPWLTWQRPQIPRPPQTESMSTPSERAASRTVVPAANRPRRPDGVKIDERLGAGRDRCGHRGSAARAGGSGRRPPPRRRLTRRPGLALGRRRPEGRGSSGRIRGRCPSGRRRP